MAENNIDRPYTRAISMLEANCDDRTILNVCSISQAELDLVRRLMVFARPNLRIDASLTRFRREGNK